MPAQVDCFGVTDIGRQRQANQDQFLIAELHKSMFVRSTSLRLDQQSRLFGSAQGQLMLVADGMGGHAAGERASSMAVDYLIERLLNSVHWFFRLEEDAEEDFLAELQGLLRAAHHRIVAEGLHHPDQKGMGTTLTMAYAIWPRLYVVHAGDSRCYLIRQGRAEQLTVDHTLARQLVDAGGLRPEDEAQSRWSNVLWNVLGGNGDGELIAEVRRVDLLPGDAVLLCTDGLYRHVGQPAMLRVLEAAADAEAACCELVRLANDAGGEDNITSIVGFFPSTPDGADQQAQTGATRPRDVDDLVDTEIE